FQIKTLLAGLGVGGIAVALAVQTILGDLFASLSIVLDKPFVIGDFLAVGEHTGTVEQIGIKTTRIRSLSGEQLVFSNADLLSSRIRNYGRMRERRAVFTVGVTYGTPPGTARRIPDLIREALAEHDEVRVDRCHFKAFGDSALIYETVYYVSDPAYNLYMDIQQEVNLELMRLFAEEGIEFAYPTRTVHLRAERAGADDPPGTGDPAPEPVRV
ncbi:MAG TPA: mechanosensitive ion channel family protein, partial [Gemmatimonadota bacterium]|nr:mechanosensitive ion channel family protein [Gemmatimonadota bacterium]